MSILLINYEYPPAGGGAANATQALARALIIRGRQVLVITSALGKKDYLENDRGCAVHRLNVGRTRPDRGRITEMLRFAVKASARVERIASAAKVEGCIAFFTLPSGLPAYWAQRRLGVPYAVSLRGGDVPGHVPGISLLHTVTRPLRRLVLHSAIARVANSRSLAETSERADPFPVHVVPNGVDTEFFRPGATLERNTVNLLFVGRLHAEKNVATLLRAMRELPTTIRSRVQLTIVGQGAEEAELQRLASSIQISRQVRWLGWQDKQNLAALYQSADIFVNPSFYEGMPNAVLEAMACGIPPIVSAVPGNLSVVTPGRNGMAFPVAQSSGLVAALTKLINDPTERRRLGSAAREHVERHHSWISAAESYLQLLSCKVDLPAPRGSRFIPASLHVSYPSPANSENT